MNRNTTQLLVVLGVLVVAGGALAAWQLFWDPLVRAEASIKRLQEENQKKEDQIAKIRKDRPQLERWRLLSLPFDLQGIKNPTKEQLERPFKDSREAYAHWLFELMGRHNLKNVRMPAPDKSDSKDVPKLSNGKEVYTRLYFKVTDLQGRFQDLVKMIDEFRKTPLLHAIKDLKLYAKDGGELMHLDFTVEALIVEGTANQQLTQVAKRIDPRLALASTILPLRGPLVPLTYWPHLSAHARAPKRDYQLMAGGWNIFRGPQPDPPPPVVMVTVPTVVGLTIDEARKRLQDAKLGIKVEGDQSAVVKTQTPKAGAKVELGGVVTATFPPPPTPRPVQDFITFARLTDVSQVGDQPVVATIWDPSYYFAMTLRNGTDTNMVFPLLKTADNIELAHAEVLHINASDIKRGVYFRVHLNVTQPEAVRALPAWFPGAFVVEMVRPYTNKKAIYAVTSQEHALLSKAKLSKGGKGGGAGSQFVKVHRVFWEELLRDKAVTVGMFNTFAFYKRIVCGQVVSQGEAFIVLRLDSKYCSYEYQLRGEKQPKQVPPHAGYCFLPVGSIVRDGLANPVSESQIRALLSTPVSKKP